MVLHLKTLRIDTSLFRPHSTRSAVTSAAKKAKVRCIDGFMATAGWHSRSVFGKYYEKPVVTSSGFADCILLARIIHVNLLQLVKKSL